ncbi:MAG: tRNA (adenosine(37)-N6)-threonylcarbamoyltransferase complex ATPase subunit type 1 TsaE [Candidatus Omnitrophota bacterium]
MITNTITHSPEETMALAERVGGSLKRGAFIALIGDLGTGKTMFVKGLAKGLGLKDYLYVNSPSFVILKEYQGFKNLYHFDVYRLDSKDFMETIDYKKYFYGNGITVVEWADKVRDALPEEYLEITIEYGRAPEERKIFFKKIGDKK